MHYKLWHHKQIHIYLQCPLKRKPALLKVPTDVVEDADAVVVTVTTMTVMIATTTIIMTTAMIVDVTAGVTRPHQEEDLVVR